MIDLIVISIILFAFFQLVQYRFGALQPIGFLGQL
jgi:hypothetical protein